MSALAAALNVVGGGVASADENDCAIQTSGGYYVEAAGGGGRTTDVMYTDQQGIGAFERFRRVYTGDPRGLWALRTYDGNSNATQVGSWETFQLVCYI